MFLGAVEDIVEPILDDLSKCPVSLKWDTFPVSCLSHHNRSCCDMALEWLRSMDFAQLNGAGLLSGPRWLRERFEWGPSAWPLHWCEAVDAKMIDCGAHAALAHEVFEARGITSFRAQFVQQYNEQAIEQWRTIWAREQVSDLWLGDDCIYHEGNAVLIGPGAVKLWDGSASCWIDPSQGGGYGSLLSLRMFAPPTWTGPDKMQWGSLRIALNQWIMLVGNAPHRALEIAAPRGRDRFTGIID